MRLFALLSFGAALLCGSLSAGENARYFKEDHLTGAAYIALASDGGYTITTREHMGVWVIESGRWSKSETGITFTPKRPHGPPYRCAEIVYRGRTFLSQEGKAGPSIPIPIEETKRALDQNPKALPRYVFFQITSTVYKQETKQPYPFRTRPKVP